MENAQIKRLIHRANYRGFKEVDLILGGFAKAYAPSFSAAEAAQFEALLAEKDHDIYEWICGRARVPTVHDTALFAKLLAYKPDIENS